MRTSAWPAWARRRVWGRLREMVRYVAPVALATACASSPAPGPSHPQGHVHHHEHGMPHRFENAEEWAKVFDEAGRDGWQKPAEVIASMEIVPGSTVVDLGAGTGYFLQHLSAAVGAEGKVIALDVEPDMVRYMKERAARERLTNVEARVVPGDDPSLAPAEAARVLVVDTWHHLGDRTAYARKLASALAPGGKLVIVDFTLESPRGPPIEHRIAPERLVDELVEAGFTAAIVVEPLPDQYIVRATR